MRNYTPTSCDATVARTHLCALLDWGLTIPSHRHHV